MCPNCRQHRHKMLHDCFRFKQPSSPHLALLMEALHIMTGIPISYSTLSYTTLYCAMQCTHLYWTLAPGIEKEYSNMVAASLTCDVTFCPCQLMHHNAGNHHCDTHACLNDSVKSCAMSCCGLLPHKALVMIARRHILFFSGL